MTISYSADVGTCRGFGNFHRLLRRWKGSLYKLVWRDAAVFLCLYTAISLFYRFYISQQSYKRPGLHRKFRAFIRYCLAYQEHLPVSFVLSFYLTVVVKKWWQVFDMIPWPDTLGTFVSMNLLGQDERGRLMRRTIMRYVNLSFVMTMQRVSVGARKRFPTENHLIEAGFLMPHEKTILQKISERSYHTTYIVPLFWAGSIIARARREGRWEDDMTLNGAMQELNKFREGLHGILVSDWLTIPLMYTQVIALALYFYFLAALFSSQFAVGGHKIDLFFPLITLSELFFYMGLMKVAETMVNPWGEDDDDWDVDFFIDRHLSVSYQIVDNISLACPPMRRDAYWDHQGAIELPYTEMALRHRINPYQGSAAGTPENLIQSRCIFRHGVPELITETPVVVDEDDEPVLEVGVVAKGTVKPTKYAPPVMDSESLRNKGALKLEYKYKKKYSML